MTQVVFLVLPGVELLDLAGPVQAFDEAAQLGADYQLRFCSSVERLTSSQGLALGPLEEFADVRLTAADIVFVPGMARPQYLPGQLGKGDQALFAWLRQAQAVGATVCSVCTGAFVLAQAGLLNGRSATTHWRRVAELQERYPQVRVLASRLFVEDDGVWTSAGIASGIDLALALIEQAHGPLFAAKVARMLVVYLRRDGSHQQHSVYLDYRSHLNPQVHQVQDWLIAHPDQKVTLEELAAIHYLSPRHLTRLFKQATGLTVKQYARLIKLEYAKTLLRNPRLSVEAVAYRCGFKDGRQLRRLWQENFNTPPSSMV